MIVVDLFAGGGGVSEGVLRARKRAPEIAVNHSPAAIAMHTVNHPDTEHYIEDVRAVDPKTACRGRPVGLLWLSPDCTDFSRAKGGKPKDGGIRGLAWVGVDWAREVRPRVIVLENVPEFRDWGPLDASGEPDPTRRGHTFARWVGQLRRLGYVVEHRTLVACDYGAPTARKRFFVIARCDSQPIVWPEPTHGPGRAHPWHTTAEYLDWSIPCPSIFERKRPLAEATMRRIAHGVRRFVLEAEAPFVVELAGGGVTAPAVVSHYGQSVGRRADAPAPTITAGGGGHHGLIVPTLIQTGYGERKGQAPRVPGLHRPIGTLVSAGRHALVAAFITKHYGGVVGHSVESTLGTITATDHHSLTTAFLTKFYGTSTGQGVDAPAPTITAGGTHIGAVQALLERHGHTGACTVVVRGETYSVVDIGMRMLTPRELFRLQGFGEHYQIDFPFRGKPLSKTLQTHLVGNSVPPALACALVDANLPEAARV